MLYASFYKNIKSPRGSYQNDSLEKEALLIIVLLLDVHLLADFRSFVGRLFAVCRPSVGRLSTDHLPTVGRQVYGGAVLHFFPCQTPRYIKEKI